VVSTPGCSARAFPARKSGPGGIRTLSISRSEREWSASCLPSHESIEQFRGLESNQRPPRSERGVTTSSNYPGSSEISKLKSPIRGGGFEPPPPGSKPSSLPVSRSPRASRGSRTRLSGLEDRCLGRSARDASISPRAEGEGVEPPRLIARPFSRRLPSPIGLPFLILRDREAPGAGIEPARSSLTGRRMNQLIHPRSG
jgi:hypothetical protein